MLNGVSAREAVCVHKRSRGDTDDPVGTSILRTTIGIGIIKLRDYVCPTPNVSPPPSTLTHPCGGHVGEGEEQGDLEDRHHVEYWVGLREGAWDRPGVRFTGTSLVFTFL